MQAAGPSPLSSAFAVMMQCSCGDCGEDASTLRNSSCMTLLGHSLLIILIIDCNVLILSAVPLGHPLGPVNATLRWRDGRGLTEEEQDYYFKRVKDGHMIFCAQRLYCNETHSIKLSVFS